MNKVRQRFERWLSWMYYAGRIWRNTVEYDEVKAAAASIHPSSEGESLQAPGESEKVWNLFLAWLKDAWLHFDCLWGYTSLASGQLQIIHINKGKFSFALLRQKLLHQTNAASTLF